MVLEDGTSPMSCSWEGSSKYNVDLVSDFQMLSLTAITAERSVLNPIQLIEQEEMDDVYVSEADTPFKDVFLHNYYYKEATDSTVEEDSEMEEPFSSKDIFKVWALDVPDDVEDEFRKRLGLSSETPCTFPKSSKDDSKKLLDNLAVGVADISLNRHS